jgi:ubiquinone/menaquinone biosynthesis C-methylase UbiE
VETDALSTLIAGLFSKSLQVRRMLLRGEREVLPVPLAETVVLARQLEPYTSPEQLAAAEADIREGLNGQRWNKRTVQLDVAEGYAGWAAQYDAEANPLIHVEEPVTLSLIGDVSGQDVLDAACGTGRYLLLLSHAAGRVCGVDASPEMLEIARAKCAGLGFQADLRQGEITCLPFADASFDVAICALALCHIADLRGAIGELARVLRPGGKLVISDFHPYGLVLGWRTSFRRDDTTFHIENHIHFLADLFGALRANGLELTDLREELVDDRLLPILGEVEVERFRGLPLALVLSACRADVPTPARKRTR